MHRCADNRGDAMIAAFGYIFLLDAAVSVRVTLTRLAENITMICTLNRSVWITTATVGAAGLLATEVAGNGIAIEIARAIRRLTIRVTRNHYTPSAVDVLEPKPSSELPPYSLSSKIMELRHLDDVRPDTKYVISVLTMHMHKPTTVHDHLANRALGYLLQTSDLRLRFSPGDLQLQAYVDASYAIHADCRSHHGAFIRLGSTSSPFHVKSSASKTIVRSSTEAEIFLRTILPLTCSGQSIS